MPAWHEREGVSMAASSKIAAYSDNQSRCGGTTTSGLGALTGTIESNSEFTLPSLKDTVKKRLLNDMIRGLASEAAGVILLADHFTLRMISCTCRMSELLEENINLVENIAMKVTLLNIMAHILLQPLVCLNYQGAWRRLPASSTSSCSHRAVFHHTDRGVRQPADC
jgi:hypothetical protein